MALKRQALAQRRKACGYTQEAFAEVLRVDRTTVQRWERGEVDPQPHQRPRMAKLLDLTRAQLDEILGAHDGLASPATTLASPANTEEPRGLDADIAHMKASAAHLLKHADRHGGDLVAPAAVQVWRSAQRKLDTGSVRENDQRAYLAAVAESAEVAGWLLFDAGQWDAARAAFLESHMLARHAGDRSMQWFALDMLAMLDIERERPAEALRIADELMCEPHIPPRVALLARVRRGRALAQMGEQKRTLTFLDAARGGAEESISPRDPGWAWWVDETEVKWHTGAALLDLGVPQEATPTIQGSLAGVTIPDGRSALHLRIGLLSAFTESRAWREAEAELEAIASLLHTVSSGRNRYLLRRVLRAIDRDSRAPVWLSHLAKETAAAIAA
ncbi:helix-turn-helix transcriptional regulator [Streptomyces sp. 7N604]|uniref:helix-turn-helix transcriptional regulator n=1 Tax=Streptomyces sp. 7N604 TaxID=3457415 RepID=UPI003FD4A488